MLHALATALAGLGIFFAGMYQLKDALKKLTGRRFKQLIAAWIHRPVAAVALGVAAGGVMQSTTAVTFVLASMIATGLLTVGGALPIVAGANVGSTMLILLANLDIQLFVLALLGLTGISFVVERLSRFRTILTAVFSVSLVFFGLKMLQSGIVPLTREPWFGDLLALAGASYFLPLVIATCLTVLSQSTSSIVLLTIALTAGGGLTFEQAMMAIYGCNIGGSFQTLLLSSNLRGRPQQLAMFQVSFNFVAASLMVPLFFIEQYAGIGLVERLIRSLSASTQLQLAYLQVIFNLVGAGLMLVLIPWFHPILAKRFPTLADEDDGRPIYIHDQALEEPDSALDLAGLEQQRLATYLIKRLEIVRERPKNAAALINRQSQNFTMLATEVHEFLRRLGEAPFDVGGYDRLDRAINRQRLLDGLNETLVDLAATAGQVAGSKASQALLGTIVEALDAVLLTMLDALQDMKGEDRAVFLAITRNRGNVMQRIRQSYLASDGNLTVAQKGTVLILTNLSERAFWLLGQLAEQEQAVDV
ncbi:Na/Pi cotransporter family protein [Oryzicola mucosus]|uniref:Na/Pi cotransporter family protein n=1 Tax=Oryzicola mucosus TaxID=2767425 RepID=A0A8J6PY16_9HYPH|nr:Na/Pi symporter [Oryzicola mucosus]MBD0417556.1 Na/Pi cotransporter family protein [Oryzicola mucosus]